MNRRRSVEIVGTASKPEFLVDSGISPGDSPLTARAASGVQAARTWLAASVRNVGTCRPDAKGETQEGSPLKGLSTDAGHGGGPARSSDEGPVMGPERRGGLVRL